uniref:NADH:ubiquinone reductase (Na(+)-transporting) subunit C n=1 Tax=Flavobacterium sp. TaxID=239 RepID=UPI0040494A09
MNRDSNGYTFLFATIMVVAVASILAFLATFLKPMQDENMKNEKMQNILSTIGVTGISREEAQSKFNEFITAQNQIALKADGTVDEQVKAFDIELKNELKKPVDQQRFPIYIAEKDGSKFYIIPLRGAGLWDAIWGYVALKDDFNTIQGVSFDHKGETPGLGAEIKQEWFTKLFENEKIFNASGELVGVAVAKGNNNTTDKDDNKVDAISGATITGNGVTDMINERLLHYKPFISNQKNKLAINN